MNVLKPRGMSRDALQVLAEAKVVLVSACLLGVECRHDGTDKRMSRIIRALEGKEVVPVCPEAAAGLGIPRPAAELEGGLGDAVLDGQARVVNVHGVDVTDAFLLGARIAVEAARRHGATVAILKERSPSCGGTRVRVSGELMAGEGVTAAALRRAGVTVLTDEQLPGGAT